MRLENLQKHEEEAKERVLAAEPIQLQRRGPLLCGEALQQPVLYIDADDTVVAAARIMREANIGFLPVCKAEGAILVGVITDRDIVTRACVGCVGEESASLEGTADLADLVVRTVMTRGAVTVSPDDSVTKALRLMRKHRISRVIVTDAKDEKFPIGIVSLSDIAQYEKASRIGRTFRAIAERKYAPERP
jgi:CBS domain-containing protein